MPASESPMIAANQEALAGHYRFHSEDYARLPTIRWDFILSVFTIPGQADVLIKAPETREPQKR